MQDIPIEYRQLNTINSLLLILSLVGLAQLSRYFSIDELSMSAIWPATGIMLAAALALGLRSLWLTMGAMFLWLLLLQEKSLVLALVAVAGQGAGVVVTCKLMQGYLNQPERHSPLKTQIILYTRGALAGGAVSASFGALGYTYFLPDLAGTRLLDIWLVFWTFEAMSIILFVPIAYFILYAPRHFLVQLSKDWQQPGFKVWLLIIALLLITAWIASLFGDSNYAAVIGFAFFPALCWFILQTRRASITWAVPAFSALFMAFSLNGWAGLPTITNIPDLVRSLMLVGGLAVMVQMIAAITAERRQLLRQFQRQATTDYLTGLHNDRFLTSQLQEILGSQPASGGAAGSGSTPWLCLLQVLHFDQIKDLLGYLGREHLEKLLAARLMGTVGHRANPARLGNGTYIFTLPSQDPQALEQALTTVYEAFNNQPFQAGDYRNQIRISLGAVPLNGTLPDHSHYLSAATQAALLASQQVYRVKLIADTQEFMQQRRRLTELLEMLKSAILEERLELFAQIIQPFSHDDEQLSFEILLRMRGPDGGLVSPAGFLPVAETFGFMQEIDRWVIHKTLTLLAANPDWLARTRKCGINLAGSSLSSPDLVRYIREQLQLTGVPAHCISFEITETESIASRATATAIISQLRALGCSVSLDDFGTGLASFDYLRSFELDYLKIDGVFIKELASSPHDRSMVRSICHVARDMGLKTIAEFVEGEDLIPLLQELGVDYGQGYGLGKPRPMTELFNNPPGH